MRSPTAARVPRPSADATRARILSAALDVFAELAFEGATVREIASRAGVTQPLLNYHFSSKDELWRTAVDQLFEALNTALRTRLEGLQGVDELTTAKLLSREFIYFSARNPQLFRIITGECKTESARLDWLTERHTGPLYEATVAMYHRLEVAGHGLAMRPAQAYYILIGAGATIFALGPECRRVAGIDPCTDDAIDAHAIAVIALLFGS